MHTTVRVHDTRSWAIAHARQANLMISIRPAIRDDRSAGLRRSMELQPPELQAAQFPIENVMCPEDTPHINVGDRFLDDDAWQTDRIAVRRE